MRQIREVRLEAMEIVLQEGMIVDRIADSRDIVKKKSIFSWSILIILCMYFIRTGPGD